MTPGVEGSDRRGRYLVLDGPDGCGKSTQAQNLCRRLEANGHPVLHLREPGSTRVGEDVRKILLDPETGSLAVESEVLLFSAARAEMIRQELRPALEKGLVVVSERSFVATLAYQALAQEPPDDALGRWILDLSARIHGPTRPDLVLLLDLDAEDCAARVSAGGQADRIEARGLAYMSRVCQGFRSMAADTGLAGFLGGADRLHLLDARGSVDAVARRIDAVLASCGVLDTPSAGEARS